MLSDVSSTSKPFARSISAAILFFLWCDLIQKKTENLCVFRFCVSTRAFNQSVFVHFIPHPQTLICRQNSTSISCWSPYWCNSSRVCIHSWTQSFSVDFLLFSLSLVQNLAPIQLPRQTLKSQATMAKEKVLIQTLTSLEDGLQYIFVFIIDGALVPVSLILLCGGGQWRTHGPAWLAAPAR